MYVGLMLSFELTVADLKSLLEIVTEMFWEEVLYTKIVLDATKNFMANESPTIFKNLFTAVCIVCVLHDSK